MNVKQTFLTGFEKGAKYVVLLDPEKLDASTGADYAARCSEAGVDALFVGGSTVALYLTDPAAPGIQGKLNEEK